MCSPYLPGEHHLHKIQHILPLERVYGDVQDQVTRHHRRQRMRDLGADVIRFLEQQGPWRYPLSEIYQEPEVQAALRQLQRYQEA
jgi:hypothetical protein